MSNADEIQRNDDPGATGRGHEEDTAEELLDQAQSNAQALIAATVAFLDERGIDPREWANAVGRRFGRGWETGADWEAGEFLDAILTNYKALGAAVLSADLGEQQAEATVFGFPDPDICQALGVETSRVDLFNDSLAPIAAERGLAWSWRTDGAETILTVRREPA